MKRFIDRDGLEWLVYWRRAGSGKFGESGLHFWSRAVHFHYPMPAEPDEITQEWFQARVDAVLDGDASEASG